MNCASGSVGGKQETKMRALTSSLPNKPRSSQNALLLKALGTETGFERYSYDFGQATTARFALPLLAWLMETIGWKGASEAKLVP